MKHSKKLDKVKHYCNAIVNGKRLWNAVCVERAVVKGWNAEEKCNRIATEDC